MLRRTLVALFVLAATRVGVPPLRLRKLAQSLRFFCSKLLFLAFALLAIHRLVLVLLAAFVEGLVDVVVPALAACRVTSVALDILPALAPKAQRLHGAVELVAAQRARRLLDGVLLASAPTSVLISATSVIRVLAVLVIKVVVRLGSSKELVELALLALLARGGCGPVLSAAGVSLHGTVLQEACPVLRILEALSRAEELAGDGLLLSCARVRVAALDGEGRVGHLRKRSKRSLKLSHRAVLSHGLDVIRRKQCLQRSPTRTILRHRRHLLVGKPAEALNEALGCLHGKLEHHCQHRRA
mmetsp:Transcript_11958/g.50310  ORF Transcript_11958/g.50310 Transcript_11958/m.50310 type:complete len:299 (-) Transcript_11958:345-1241(-)